MSTPIPQDSGGPNVRAVYRYLFAILQARYPGFAASPADADDLVQEVLLRAVQHMALSPGRLSVTERRWLRVVLVRVAIDAIRRRHTTRRLTQCGVELLSPTWSSALDGLLAAEEYELLRSAIARLPEGDRTAVEGVLAGHSLAELSDRLHITVAAVRKRYTRATVRLRRKIAASV